MALALLDQQQRKSIEYLRKAFRIQPMDSNSNVAMTLTRLLAGPWGLACHYGLLKSYERSAGCF